MRRKCLAAFAKRSQNATARDELDLDTLLAELERVIQETLQPDGVAVWLRQAKGLRNPAITGSATAGAENS